MDAEDLYLSSYTSGSNWKAKGMVHHSRLYNEHIHLKCI
jgi:acyl-coenzyme A synthetase/AMP-(fatty) acid ligase